MSLSYIRSAREAEVNAAYRMREMGFTDAVATPPGPDSGVDVVADDAVAQVKWEAASTGRPALQRFWGATATLAVRERLFISAAGFSRGAVDYADRMQISLYTYSPLGDLTPVNEVASQLPLRNGRALADFPTLAQFDPGKAASPRTHHSAVPPHSVDASRNKRLTAEEWSAKYVRKPTYQIEKEKRLAERRRADAEERKKQFEAAQIEAIKKRENRASE